MSCASRKKMIAKTIANRNSPIPNEGEFRPAGAVLGDLVVIGVAPKSGTY
jgi:hypothetical protein